MALAAIRSLGRGVDPGMRRHTGEWRLQNSRYKANLTLPIKHPLARGGILRQRYDSRERVSSSGRLCRTIAVTAASRSPPGRTGVPEASTRIT